MTAVEYRVLLSFKVLTLDSKRVSVLYGVLATGSGIPCVHHDAMTRSRCTEKASPGQAKGSKLPHEPRLALFRDHYRPACVSTTLVQPYTEGFNQVVSYLSRQVAKASIS